MTNESLLSVGQLYDRGLKAIFTKDVLQIKQGRKTVITGKRNTKDGLWDVLFSTNKNSIYANYIVTLG